MSLKSTISDLNIHRIEIAEFKNSESLIPAGKPVKIINKFYPKINRRRVLSVSPRRKNYMAMTMNRARNVPSPELKIRSFLGSTQKPSVESKLTSKSLSLNHYLT